MLSCGAPAVQYEGEAHRNLIGGPAAGIQVRFERTGGVEIDPPVVEALTDADGEFLLEATALQSGIVEGELDFYFWDGSPIWSVPDVQLSTTKAEGDTRSLGRIYVPFPHFASVGQIYELSTGAPLQGVPVEFRRTGGVEIEPAVFQTVTDAFGNFPFEPLARAQGDVVGTMTIEVGGRQISVEAVHQLSEPGDRDRTEAGECACREQRGGH